MATAQHYNLAIIIQEQRRGNAVRQLKQEVALLRQQMNQTGGAIGEAEEELDEFEDTANKTGEKIKNVLVTALVLAAAAAANFARQSITEFAEFDQKIKETFTLIPDASAEFRETMTADIRDVGLQFGRLTDETVPALYQALSAGIPRENAIQAVETASMAAIGGVAELEGTMKTGMAVFNAYGGEAYTLEEVYDILFTTIRHGVITMSELNTALSRVTSVAAESRTPFEDIAAALVVMTRQGDSAAEATELLSFLLIQLGTEGTAAANTFRDATGRGYREWIKTGHTLIEGLVALQKHSDDTGQSLASMIGGDTKFFRDMQAGRAIIELTGLQLENMIEQGENMADTGGAMAEAYSIASDNLQFDLDKAAASVEGLKIQTGELLTTTEVLGTDGGEAIKGFTLIVDSMSGALGRAALKKWVDSLPKEPDFDDATAGLLRIADALTIINRYVLGKQGVRDLIAAGVDLAATTAKSYAEFEALMIESELVDKKFTVDDTGFGWEQDPTDTTGIWPFNTRRTFEYQLEGTGQPIDELYNEIKAVEKLTERNNILNFSRQTLANNIKNLQTPAERAATEQLEAYAAQQEVAAIAAKEHEAALNLERGELLLSEAVFEAQAWVIAKTRVEYTQLSDAQTTYMSSIRESSDVFVSAFADYMEAQGEWKTVVIDNSHQMAGIQEQLTADLTNEQKDMYNEILDTAEEGGERWLGAWHALQGDLGKTQRHGLVARLADLEQNQGKSVNILNMDREAAEEAGGAVLEAFEAISLAWEKLSLDIATNRIQAELEGETKEAALATLELERAMGIIDDEQYDFLTRQLEQSTTLKPILDEMLTQYLIDSELSKTESENIAQAMELVNTNAGILTDEGLRNLINAVIDPIDGVPAVGAKIQTFMIEPVEEVEEALGRVTKDIWVPDVGLDTTLFDEGVLGIWLDIDKLILNPHTIQFAYQVLNSPPPTPDSGQHTGTSGFTVPGGFERDSYLMGLTSGEFVTVTTPGQRAREGGGGGGYIDNRDQSVYMVNNGAGAAAVARAWVEMKRRSRINSWLGVT